MARDAELAEGLGDAPQEVVAKGVLVPQLDNQVVLQVAQRGRASEQEKESERAKDREGKKEDVERRMGDSRSEGAGSGIMQAPRTRTGK